MPRFRCAQVLPLLRSSASVLLLAVPDALRSGKWRDDVAALPAVRRIQEARVWSHTRREQPPLMTLCPMLKTPKHHNPRHEATVFHPER